MYLCKSGMRKRICKLVKARKCLLLSEQSDNGTSWIVQKRQMEIADFIGNTSPDWLLLEVKFCIWKREV